MRVVLVNPHTLIQPQDPLTTGIYYFPITLALLAASLREAGHTVRVVDAFGEAPTRVRPWGSWWIQGLSFDEVAARVTQEPADAVLLYAGNLVSHEATVQVLKTIVRKGGAGFRAVIENTQAVTAYALKTVLPEFFDAGAQAVLTGECEQRGVRLLAALSQNTPPSSIDGIYTREGGEIQGGPPQGYIEDLDALPFPAWDLFPIHNYWRLHYAHGPVSAGRWLPLLTSRGCPYPCHFCVVPETNKMKWRARSAASVTREMSFWQERLEVSEFHIEDLNPTVDENRVLELCSAIETAKLAVTWKIVAGTKLDMLKDPHTLERMAGAGCRYASFSPESGSPEMLKRMGKPFRHEMMLDSVGLMNKRGIRSQACFVVGFPGETDADRQLTRDYIKKLVKAGLDEVALFICTPAPGSDLFGKEEGYGSLSELSFSPTWRANYVTLSRYRLGTYLRFMLWKLLSHPAKILTQPFYFLARRFQTKMEMTPYRALSVLYWRWCHG